MESNFHCVNGSQLIHVVPQRRNLNLNSFGAIDAISHNCCKLCLLLSAHFIPYFQVFLHRSFYHWLQPLSKEIKFPSLNLCPSRTDIMANLHKKKNTPVKHCTTVSVGMQQKENCIRQVLHKIPNARHYRKKKLF